MLEFDFHARAGTFELHAAGKQATAATGLFGPSGCGKTTLLHCLAGLLRPMRGYIRFRGRTLFDSARRVCLAPQKRRVGYVFQDDRLFPHMTVRANLQYGRRGDGRSVDLAELIDVLDLGDMLGRLPEGLSGGQRQRVALGRALAAGPELLLLDEPLASVDEPSRLRILTYLKHAYEKWHVPFVYVSHTLTEILFLAERAWQMADGRILRLAEPHDLVAGTDPGVSPIENVLTGVVTDNPPHAGYARVQCGSLELNVPGKGLRVGQEVAVAIPARDLMVSLARPTGISARNVIPVRIEEMTQSGLALWITVRAGDNEIVVELTEAAAIELGLREGMDVYVLVKVHSIRATAVQAAGGEPAADP